MVDSKDGPVAAITATTSSKTTRARKPKVVTGAVDAAPVPVMDTGLAPTDPDPVDAVPVQTIAVLPVSPAQPAGILETVTSPVVESDIIPDPAARAASISEGSVEMANYIPQGDAAEKAQAMFGDMSGRVKSAFEKSTKFGEEMVDFSKGNVEAMVASAKVAAKAAESLGQDAAEYGKKNFESASAAFKSFASVRSPAELFQLQSEFAKASFDSAVAEASKMSESMMKLAGEIAQPLSNRYALAAEKIKSATSL